MDSNGLKITTCRVLITVIVLRLPVITRSDAGGRPNERSILNFVITREQPAANNERDGDTIPLRGI